MVTAITAVGWQPLFLRIHRSGEKKNNDWHSSEYQEQLYTLDHATFYSNLRQLFLAKSKTNDRS